MHPRVGVLAAGLAAHGDEVVECNATLRLDTAARVAMLRQPWRLPLLAWRLLTAWVTLVGRARSMGTAGEFDAVLVGYLGHFDVVLARLLFRRTTLVLDHLISAGDTAVDRGQGGGLRQVALRGLDRLATSCADIVVVDTDEHLALLPARARHKGVVAAVGAAAEWFTARRALRGPADRQPARLRVVFFGQFAPLQGAPVIAAACAALRASAGSPVEVTMIGTGQDLGEARRAARGAPIDWRGWVEPEQLAALVATYDVCLGIFGAGPKALRVVPNKIYQGAAAGCAIITSDTAPQRRALGDAAIYVAPGDAEALSAALLDLAADPDRVHDLRHRAAARADETFTAASVVTALRARLAS